MRRSLKKSLSVFLCVILIITMLIPALSSFSASVTIEITKDGATVTDTVSVQEYSTISLDYSLSTNMPDGAYVIWESNLPLLAGFDDETVGELTGYDYSKGAVFQQWLDEDVRSTPLVGETLANSIESALEAAGVDINTADTGTIVTIVRTIAGDTLADSLQSMLDNMTVEVTATLYSSTGEKIASDKINVLVEEYSLGIAGNVYPTGVHITNRRVVPTVVAVGTSVQLYGAVTPVRCLFNLSWSMGKNVLDTTSKNYASVTDDGLVTFNAAGTASVRATGSIKSTYITFTIVDPADLPVTDFTITGESTVSEGETVQLAIDNLIPAGAYMGDLVWSSEDSSIAVVDQNGVVTGLDAGSGLITSSQSTKIYAKIGNVTKAFTVTVSRNLLSGTSISAVEISGDTAIGIGKTYKYTATVLPSRINTSSDVSRAWGLIDPVTKEKLYATSGNPANDSYGTITTDGTFTGLKDGTSNIFVEATYNGTTVTDTYTVTIGTAITNFTINGTSSINEGATTQLTISGVTPSNAVYDTVAWSSSDPTIASVDENGLVTGLDAGGNYSIFNNPSQTVTITATINGVSKSISVTVKAKLGLNAYTGGQINGTDYIIVDLPYTYTATHTPERMSIYRQFWGTPDSNGNAPWSTSSSISSMSNTANNYISVDSTTGLVTGLQAGSTEIWTYMANNLLSSSYQTLKKDISVIELVPKSMTVVAPDKYTYIEGETQLDLTGMSVAFTYDKNEVIKYYPEAASWSDDKFTVEISDYTVSEINTSLLDAEQYIMVTAERAGRTLRQIFPIYVESKQVDKVEIKEYPRYVYLEGETQLDISNLKVVASYLNANSEEITSYTVNTAEFNPELLNVEQNITVSYTHAGRSASTTFPVIVYGVPVVSVTTEPSDYSGGWTKDDVTFVLDSTHQLDGITYYYSTGTDSNWIVLSGNSLTVNTNQEETYYFKAVNGKNVEGASTVGYKVSIDKVTPIFNLTQEITGITNQSYNVFVDINTLGASGIQSILLNNVDITGNNSFIVDSNGLYTVKIISVSGLEAEQSIVIENIDKIAPKVININLEHKNIGGFARFINTMTFGLFFKETVEATINATDYGVAGVDYIEYRYLDENGSPITEWAFYNENDKPTQDPDFKGYIEAIVTDKATNVSDSYYSEGYVIDGTVPTDIKITATDANGLYVSDSWTSTDVSIKLSSTAFSDIYMYYYSTDNGNTWNEVVGDTIVASTHGITHYQFKAESYSGLESGIANYTVKLDKTTPVIRVDFEGTFGRWTSGNVKFSFTTLSEAISGVTYYYSTNSGADWVEITTGDEILINDNTNATYIFKAINGAGVESNPSDSYKVMIDNVAPSIEFTPEKTTYTTEPYDVAFNISTGESGLASVNVNGVDITGTDKFTVSENGNYVFVMTGNNGITSTAVLKIENFISYEIKITSIDFTSTNGFANYFNEPFGKYFNEKVTVSMSASCNDGAIGRIEYRFVDENGNPTGEWSIYDKENKPTVESNFRGTIEARAFDTTGTKMSDIYTSEEITVDFIAPTAPIVNATVKGEEYTSNWTGENIDVVLSSSAYSGIYEYYYRVDGGEWLKLNNNVVSLKDVGEHNYEFKSVSKAGLESSVSSLKTKLESAIPALSVAVDGTIGHRTYDDVTFTLSSPSTISGITYYYNTGDGWQEIDGDTITVDSSCDKTYYFKGINGAGVESYQSPAYRVIVDKNYLLVEKKPIINVSVSGTTNEWTANAVVFTLSSVECEGAVKYYYDNGNGWTVLENNTLLVNDETVSTYKFKAIDETGRESIESAEYSIMIDTVAPSVSVVLDNTDFTNSIRTAIVTATAGVSGVKSIIVNGTDITDTNTFEVAENGKYTVTVTAKNGLSATTILDVSSFDYDAPRIVDISMKHKNTGDFARFINMITFGLFFNEEVEITIVAEDFGASGLEKIEYRIVDENGNSVTDWSVYDESNKPTVDVEFKGFVEARAVDNAGNSSPEVTSQGFVIDKNKPTDIKVDAIANDEEYNGTFTSNDIILTPSATAFSDIHSYMYSIDDGEWNIMTTESIVAIDGIHTYKFKAVSNANLESDVVSIITKVEKGTPELTVNVAGTIGAWTSNDVVFTLNSTNGISGTTYYYNNGNGWIEMNSNVLSITENINAAYIFKAVNGTGTESLISDEYLVMTDKTIPAIDINANITEFTNEDICLSVEILDIGICGIESATVNGNPFDGEQLIVGENGTYVFTVTLKNGNKVSESVVVTNIDKENPIITEINTGKANSVVDEILIYGNETRVDITAKDFGCSDIQKIEYRLVNSNNLFTRIGFDGFWKEYDANEKPMLVDDFNGYIEVRVTDKAGNISDIVTSENIIVDTDKPEITVDSDYDNEWTNNNITFELSGDADSGIAHYMYKLDSGEWTKLEGNVFIADADGVHTYCFMSVSNAGLESDKIEVITKMEKETPEILVNPIGITGKWTNENIIFELDCINCNSGTKYFYNNGDGWTEISENKLSITNNTNKTYKFKVVNGAGSESAESEDYIVKLDNDKPKAFKVNAESDGKAFKNGAILTKGVKITLFAESESGISKYQYSLNGEEWVDMDSNTLNITEEGFYSYTFRAVSESGEVSNTKQIAFTYDKDYNVNYVKNPDIPNTEYAATVVFLGIPLFVIGFVLAKRKRKENDFTN